MYNDWDLVEVILLYRVVGHELRTVTVEYLIYFGIYENEVYCKMLLKIRNFLVPFPLRMFLRTSTRVSQWQSVN